MITNDYMNYWMIVILNRLWSNILWNSIDISSSDDSSESVSEANLINMNSKQ